jgi:hypothetical protein
MTGQAADRLAHPMRSRLHACAPLRLAKRLLVPTVLVAILAVPAVASADPVFGSINATGGIFWRSQPNWNTPIAVNGTGVYPGTLISVQCYQSGTTVPGSTETMWVQASVVGGPGSGSGWVSEHFVGDNAPLDQAAPGVPRCTSAAAPAPTSVPVVSCFGDWCSGKDPMATGCDQDAVTVQTLSLSGAQLDLRWSPTCQSAWARWVQYPVGLQSDTPTGLEVLQDTGYAQSAAGFDFNGYPTDAAAASAWNAQGAQISVADAEANLNQSGFEAWTPMIYSPQHEVEAIATVQCGSDSILGTAVDCALNGKVQTSYWAQ